MNTYRRIQLHLIVPGNRIYDHLLCNRCPAKLQTRIAVPVSFLIIRVRTYMLGYSSRARIIFAADSQVIKLNSNPLCT